PATPLVGATRGGFAASVISAEPAVRAVTGEIDSALEHLRVTGVTLHRLPLIHDMSGDLSVGEFQRQVPFLPQRYFMVFDVPTADIRGEHAHRTCHQFL